MAISTFYFSSPIGILHVQLSDDGLQSCSFVEQALSEVIEHPAEAQQIKDLLKSYFESGNLAPFPIDPKVGTPFQQSVWQQLKNIPKGQTVSYLDIAKRLKMPKAAQAIGNANGQNPILLFHPCHRVIGSTGKLVGYSGGLWRKEWLLAKEGATLF
jgi:methylated-DNA-[protein]-cysteine S-methyltransferase